MRNKDGNKTSRAFDLPKINFVDLYDSTADTLQK